MWLGKSVLSRALTSPKKQLESLFVSSLIRKKQLTHNSLYIIIYIVLTSIIKNIFYPNYVVVYLSPLPIKLILHKPLCYSLKETTTTQIIKSPKTRIQKKRRTINDHFSFFYLILQINFKTNIPNQSPQLKLNDTYIESAEQIQTTRPTI